MIPNLAYLNFLPARLSMNPMVVNMEAANVSTYPDRAGLRYYCTVRVPESYLSASYTDLVRLEAAETPPVPAGPGLLYQGAFFEIQNQLDPLLERTAPEFNQARISVADKLVSPYYCVLSVENDDEEVSSVTLPVEYVVKAGIAEVDYAPYKELFFSDYIGSQRRFLTWAKNDKVLQPDQPEFLYFLTNCNPVPSLLKLCYEVRYIDYATETESAFELANILPYTAYCVPVGPKALGLDLKEKEILDYQVWLENESGQRISEIRAYRMSQDYHRNIRFIVFANSLGGFDTLAMTGQGDETLKLSRNVSERFTGWEFLPSYSEKVINQVTGQRMLSIATGWLKKEELRYLEELMLSKEVYLVTDRAFVPLIPREDAIRTAIDDEDLIGRTLSFDFGNPQTNFSALPDPSYLPIRSTGWRPIASACLLDAFGKRTGARQATILEKYYLDDGKKVTGVALKANVPGTEGYIPPIASPDCAETPYVNTLISRQGTYNKRGCVAPLQGGPATIVVAAGTYGSEVSQADAQAKAEAAWSRLNTQLYADQNGTCVLEPEKYEYAVPVNFWHYRAADPSNIALHWFISGDGKPQIGNAWMIQGQTNAYVFPMNSNDLNYPMNYQGVGWRMLIYGPAGSTRRVKVYQNGTLRLNYTVVMNRDGYEYVPFINYSGQSFVLASQDKIYISNEAA